MKDRAWAEGSGLGDNATVERHAAFRFGLEKLKTACGLVLRDADHVVAAHRHVAVIFPTQPLNRNAVPGLSGDEFGREDFVEVAGPDGFRCRELPSDELRRGGLSKTG